VRKLDPPESVPGVLLVRGQVALGPGAALPKQEVAPARTAIGECLSLMSVAHRSFASEQAKASFAAILLGSRSARLRNST